MIPGPITDYINYSVVNQYMSRTESLPMWNQEPPSQFFIDDVRRLSVIYTSPCFREIMKGMVLNTLTTNQQAMSVFSTNKRYIETFHLSLLARVYYIAQEIERDTVSGLRHAYNTIRELSYNTLPAYVVYYNNANVLSDEETERFFQEFNNVFSTLNNIVEPVYTEHYSNVQIIS
jgi:hypothetical protein